MKGKFLDTAIKIIMLTGVFFVIINYSGYLLNVGAEKEADKLSNKEKFASSQTEVISNIGVAITTNVGTRYKQIKETPVVTYKDVIDVGYVLGNENIAKDALITGHMLFLNEYFQVLKTDIKSLLSQSNDRSFALDSFIAQLEYRYRTASSNMQILTNQKQELITAYESSSKEIENLKTKIGSDFSQFNNNATIKNIDDYLRLKVTNTNAQTYIVFINKFLNYYTILNNYNKKVLDTLINNKEILIKNSQVVIPDTGGELLKQLKLIYTEEEWKGQ